MGAALVMIAIFLLPAATAAATGQNSVVNAPTFKPKLTLVGTVNLSNIGPAPVPTTSGARASTPTRRVVDQKLLSHRPAGVAAGPQATATPITTSEVTGEHGFAGLNGVQQATANNGLDLEPPDQGLCAGAGFIGEFINNAFTVYTSGGFQLLPVIPSPKIFKQPSTAFFSDPRCYYDAPTGRWFLQEFIVGTVKAGKATSPSLQFLAVSDTKDPTGRYHIWAWNTTDASTAGCPCFGDYDNLGADNNGIYVTTDEFSIAGPAYNGVVLYAVSKETIETFPNSGIAPTVFGYRVRSDFFGQPFVLAPTSTPQGAKFAPNTEYFMETNGDALADNHVVVYALHDTSVLASPPSGAPPTLFRTVVKTEPYAQPPDAVQRPGFRPLGASVQDPEGPIQADFDAMMETTSVNGHLYGQFDTATASGNDAVAWLQLTPTLSGSTLTAKVAHQGYVKPAHASTLYPYTALDENGKGYLLFSLSGKNNYPSAAYVAFGPKGPTGPVHVAAAGAGPEDSFTCYAAFVGPNFGGCRWGDYSMGVASNGRVYMSTEIVPSSSRDTLTNWGTFVWSAPPTT
ncbi:MAG: hypothetical protein J2P57_03645 [Acidimicrobiaceae bacterium]|nr:hypothetical protein [Acidimicrobiaceae bacterium]